MKSGLIASRTLELKLSKIESVLVNLTIVERIHGFIDVVIIGTGGTRETFIDIRKPAVFRKKFQETI